MVRGQKNPIRNMGETVPSPYKAGLFHSRKEKSNLISWAQCRIGLVRELKPL